jgi:uridine monophosphate synthetase
MEAGCREDGSGILVNAARSVADAPDPAKAARELRDRMEEARAKALHKGRKVQGLGLAPAGSKAPGPASDAGLKHSLIAALVSTKCLKFGDFVLKSGMHSPFYIDLRRLVADPEAMALAGKAYASLAESLDFASIAGIPAAGLPLATAASLASGRPMIWPRMPVKEHGTGNRVEGEWKPGQKALLLDDLITTGASKLEAAQILRGEGLVIEDLVVLIERGRMGRQDMDKAGIRLHAFLHVRELFAACEALGILDGKQRAELEAFVDAE